MEEISYPIAETFRSPQGEGLYAGTLMQFIRFAGCSVGVPFKNLQERQQWVQVHNEPVSKYQEKCCSAGGEEFLCDTNFQMSRKMTGEDIAKAAIGVSRICLTGGEPLVHDLKPLVKILREKAWLHLETSGTKPIPEYFSEHWVTVSPKVNYLEKSLHAADEIKILVGPAFDEKAFVAEFLNRYSAIIFLQPINEENLVRQSSLQQCLELQQKYPEVRISTQLHKIWNVR